MKKRLLGILPLILPFAAMKEGEDGEDRSKQFLEGLGLSEEIKAAISNKETPIEDVVKTYTSNFTETTKKLYFTEWDEGKKAELIKQSQIGTYNTVEKKVSEILGISADEYKDVDKGRLEKMLSDAAARYNATIEDLKKKGGKKDDATTQQLIDQLKAANEELTGLRELKESYPDQLEAAKKEVEDKYFIGQSLHSAIDGIENIMPGIDKETIIMHLDKKALLEVEDKDGKKVISIKDPNTKTPIKKTATNIYTSLPNFIQKEILEAKGWIQKQNPKTQPTIKGGEGDSTKKQWKPHPNALKAVE